MQEKEASIKGLCTIVKGLFRMIYSCRQEKWMSKMKNLLGTAACLLFLVIPLWRGQATARADSQEVAPRAAVATATSAPSASPSPTPEAVRGRPPLSLTLMLIFTGCSLALVIGFVVIGAIVAMRNRRE